MPLTRDFKETIQERARRDAWNKSRSCPDEFVTRVVSPLETHRVIGSPGFRDTNANFIAIDSVGDRS